MGITVSNKCNNSCLFCEALKLKGNYYKTHDNIVKEIKELKNKERIFLPCNFDTRDDLIFILKEIRNLFHEVYLMTNCRMFYYKNFLMNIIGYIDHFYINLICDKKLSNEIYGKGSFEQSIIGIKNLLGSNTKIDFLMFINKYMLKDGLDYFIYKISDDKFKNKSTIYKIKKFYKRPKKAIRILCNLLKKQYPQCNFIPYYIISNNIKDLIDIIAFLISKNGGIRRLFIYNKNYNKYKSIYYNKKNKFKKILINSFCKSKYIINKNISKVKLKKITPYIIPEIDNEIRLFIIVKNESKRLDYFIKYYFKKGVDKIFIIDNNSTDETVLLCSSYKDVYIFKTTELYDKHWNWMEILLENYGKNHWCVVVDIDEFLIYPYDDILSIRDLCSYLDLNKYNALKCLLLDMYSNKPTNYNNYKIGDNPLSICNYFDEKYITIKEEFFFNYKNFKKFKFDVFAGGIRSRIFDLHRVFLSKVPLFKYNDNMYLTQGMHALDCAALSDIQGVVLHFKYLSDFNLRIINESKNKGRIKIDKNYELYLKKIKTNSEIIFYNKNSIQFKNWNQLLDLGMMKNSLKLDNYINNLY